MKVGFGDTFFKSLERLHRYEAWHNRMWRAITGDLWQFFKNIWRFRKELWDHRWWDYSYTVNMLRRSLIIMEEGMHEGMEIRETRSKKIEKMQRAIELLSHVRTDSFIEMAEAELGEIVHHEWEWEETEETTDNPLGEKKEKLYRLIDKDTPEEAEHNRKVFARAREIEEAEWKELWIIFQGQDYDKFNKDQEWNDQFDGTGLRGWWD